MPRMTDAEYRAYLAKNEHHSAEDCMEKPKHNVAESEARLHRDILDECARRGWIAFHGSMAHRAMRTPGEPDFVIMATAGRCILVEAKTRTGKLSVDQNAIAAWARKLGHRVHVVRSFKAFLEVAK